MRPIFFYSMHELNQALDNNPDLLDIITHIVIRYCVYAVSHGTQEVKVVSAEEAKALKARPDYSPPNYMEYYRGGFVTGTQREASQLQEIIFRPRVEVDHGQHRAMASTLVGAEARASARACTRVGVGAGTTAHRISELFPEPSHQSSSPIPEVTVIPPTPATAAPPPRHLPVLRRGISQHYLSASSRRAPPPGMEVFYVLDSHYPRIPCLQHSNVPVVVDGVAQTGIYHANLLSHPTPDKHTIISQHPKSTVRSQKHLWLMMQQQRTQLVLDLTHPTEARALGRPYYPSEVGEALTFEEIQVTRLEDSCEGHECYEIFDITTLKTHIVMRHHHRHWYWNEITGCDALQSLATLYNTYDRCLLLGKEAMSRPAMVAAAGCLLTLWQNEWLTRTNRDEVIALVVEKIRIERGTGALNKPAHIQCLRDYCDHLFASQACSR